MTRRTDCQRFEDLLDRAVADEVAWTPDEAAFVERHCAACDDCALSASLVDGLRGLGSDPRGDEPGDAMLELKARQILAEADRRPAAGRGRGLAWTGAAVAALAIAAAVALVVLPGRREATVPAPELGVGQGVAGDAVPDPAPAVTMTRVAGSASVTDRLAVEGDTLRRGDTVEVDQGTLLLTLADGSTACLERGGRMAVIDSAPGATRLRLDRGLAAFAVQPLDRGAVFAVDTPAGEVRVVGTEFSVEVGDAGHEIAVAEGAVTLVTRGGERTLIEAGHAFHTTRGTRPLDEAEVAAIGLLARTGEPAAETSAAAEVVSTTIHPSPLISGPAEHAPRPAADLLDEARRCRAGGDWPGAARAYEELAAEHPDSPEALAGLVSLGEVQLDKLGQPDRAVASFSRYLETAPAGPLAEEAEWGLAEAHRALGQPEQERAALEAFRQRYPDSLYDGAARRRLEELR